MLDFFRKRSQSVVAKFLLTMLAITFVLFFGISDVIKKITGKDYVLKVGGIKISPFDFKNEKAKRLGMLRGHQPDVDEKSLTVNILHQLIWESIIDQATYEYGIVVSDETLKRYIAGMNMFLDKEGVFNANLLRTFLQRIQVPESMFLESSKKDIKNLLIRSPFVYISVSPEINQFTHAYLEKRKIAILELTPSFFKITEKPSRETLEEFYSSHNKLFLEKERRSFKILELKESSVAVKVSEEEVKEAYEISTEKDDRSFAEMKSELHTNLMQEKLQSEVNALTRQIEDALMAGEEVSEVAKKFKLNIIQANDVDSKNKDIQAQDVVKLPYKDDVITVAFSIDEGTDSSFSEALDAEKNKVYWLVHMDNVVPEHVAPFDTVTNAVIKEWILDRQREKAIEVVQNSITKIKEGASLEKIAAENKFSVTITSPFDRYADHDGKGIKCKEIIDEIREEVFALKKAEANYKEIKGTFVLYQTRDIIFPKEISKENNEKYLSKLRKEIVQDMYQQLVSHLHKKYETTINYELLKNINEEVNPDTLSDVF
ncbi:MAG: SurA N-terminal domain-containing protein [Holosporaceae bacterium]|jgi:hypothetical protein|nr:SurA N-terminal domain-containing protein [Holosporaceae bacterium]